MALPDVLEELVRSWPERLDRMDDSSIRTVWSELSRLLHTGQWDPADLLQAASVSPDDPIWSALEAQSTRRLGRPDPEILVVAAELRMLIEFKTPPAGPGKAPSVSVEDVADEAEASVLDVPSRVVASGHVAGVVVVPSAKQFVAPSFQFGPDGKVLPTVAEVNRILDADDDPWGVASWWLSPHAALHGIPADQLRSGRAADVRAAAAAAGNRP
jgi:hypothetical protein